MLQSFYSHYMFTVTVELSRSDLHSNSNPWQKHKLWLNQNGHTNVVSRTINGDIYICCICVWMGIVKSAMYQTGITATSWESRIRNSQYSTLLIVRSNWNIRITSHLCDLISWSGMTHGRAVQIQRFTHPCDTRLYCERSDCWFHYEI